MTDTPDWNTSTNVTNEYIPVNELIFIGSNTITTGATPPTSQTVPIETNIGINNQFDTFYVVVKTDSTLLTGIDTSSTIELLLFGDSLITFGADQTNGAAVFSGGPLNDLYPVLFDSVSVTINSSNFASNTTYDYNLYAIKNVKPSVTVQNQIQITEHAGTITTSSTWQDIGTLAVPSYYFLFQNQGSGTMRIAFSDTTAPTGRGIQIDQGVIFVNADVSQIVNNATGYHVWVIGDTAGDEFVLWTG